MDDKQHGEARPDMLFVSPDEVVSPYERRKSDPLYASSQTFSNQEAAKPLTIEAMEEAIASLPPDWREQQRKAELYTNLHWYTDHFGIQITFSGKGYP